MNHTNRKWQTHVLKIFPFLRNDISLKIFYRHTNLTQKNYGVQSHHLMKLFQTYMINRKAELYVNRSRGKVDANDIIPSGSQFVSF